MILLKPDIENGVNKKLIERIKSDWRSQRPHMTTDDAIIMSLDGLSDICDYKTKYDDKWVERKDRTVWKEEVIEQDLIKRYIERIRHNCFSTWHPKDEDLSELSTAHEDTIITAALVFYNSRLDIYAYMATGVKPK